METIRDFVRKIARDKGLTLLELTGRLGYRSKTSLERLMNGTTRGDSLKRFEESMLRAFELTDGERAELHRAVQVATHGEEAYLVSLKMWDFVAGRAPDSGQALQILDVRSGRPVNLAARYAGKGVRAAVFNCPHITPLFEVLGELLKEEGVRVEHYLHTDFDGVRTMSAMNMLMSVFYRRGYSGYTFTPPPEEAEHYCGIRTADLAVFDYVDEAGEACEDIISFYAPNAGRLMTVKGTHGQIERLLGIDTRSFRPIKRTYTECSAFEDYIQYSENYAALEYNRSVWKLKPDVGVDQIPAHILADALLRSLPEEIDRQTLEALRAVYERRYANTCAKRRHAYTIMKRGAMEQFARTGRTSDHFWMMDGYTPAERVEILQGLLEQQQSNRYLHMFFLREDDAVRDVEIALYEETGMLFLEADTDYNLQNGHSEALITHAEVLRLYREFFENVLLEDCALPESETCRILEELIELARAQM